MIYRDPDTGRFITHDRWEELQGYVDVYEEMPDLEDWDTFGEEEIY